MNEFRLRQLIPGASKSFIQLNAKDKSNDKPSGSITERTVLDGADGKAKGKKKDSERRIVRITSYRRRPIDPDNLIGKYFLDSLRYAGLLHDDREKDIIYQIVQKEVETEDQAKTLIEIS